MIVPEKVFIREPITSSSARSPLGWKKSLAIFLIIFGVLALVGGAIFVYRQAISKKETKVETPLASSTPTPFAEEPTPILSPADEKEKAGLKIQILNGGGVAGAATEAANFLKEKGYQEIKTGNAKTFDYQKAEIQIKESKKGYLSELIKDLAGQFVVNEEVVTLKEEDNFDVIVILGQGQTD